MEGKASFMDVRCPFMVMNCPSMDANCPSIDGNCQSISSVGADGLQHLLLLPSLFMSAVCLCTVPFMERTASFMDVRCTFISMDCPSSDANCPSIDANCPSISGVSAGGRGRVRRRFARRRASFFARKQYRVSCVDTGAPCFCGDGMLSV